MNWALFPAMQRAWSVIAAGLRDEITTDAPSRAREEPSMLEHGLEALDELALREPRWRFVWLDPRVQLRLLFQLEAGRGRLSRRYASAFIDTFLTLAAQAYLRDALEPVPQTLPLSLDTP
jgi:hypothetical protein